MKKQHKKRTSQSRKTRHKKMDPTKKKSKKNSVNKQKHHKKRRKSSSNKNKKKKSMKKNHRKLKKINLKKIILSISITIGLYVLLFFTFFSTGKMEGYSMLPTIGNANVVSVSRYSKIKRFDLVYLKSPKNPKEKVIRRVIGVPGDNLYFKEDDLFVNGEGKAEPYLTAKKKMIDPMILTEDFNLKDVTNQESVPEKKYFVLGDNRKSSTDSRSYGFVSEEMIIGKVTGRIFPISHFKIF